MFPLPAANLLNQQAHERGTAIPSLTLFEVALFEDGAQKIVLVLNEMVLVIVLVLESPVSSTSTVVD